MVHMHAFGIDLSVGCWMIMYVVIGGDNKHSCAGRDASDEDGTAAHDDLHQRFIKINIRQKL